MKKGLCIVVGISYCLLALSNPESGITPLTSSEPKLPPVSVIQPISATQPGIFSDVKVTLAYTHNGERISRTAGPWDPAFEMLTETTGRYITLREPVQFNKNMCIGIAIGFTLAVVTIGSLMWFLKNLMSKRREG
jgi:hypothetical protein